MRVPFISIVIANYNGDRYLRTCLTSLLRSSVANFEVIVIDNNSTDTSLKIVSEFQKKDSRVKKMKNKTNIGVPASRNRAIDKCKGDIIILLDNDTQLLKNSLEELVKPLLESEDIGATQALLLDFENREIIQMAGGRLIPQAIWLICFYQWDEYTRVKNKINPFNIIAISAAIAVKREVIKKIGGYDKLLHNYTDDLDFSWRIWIAGFRVVLANKSIIYHHTKSVAKRANIGANNFDIYFQMAKNSFRSIFKNYEITNVIRYLPISVLINLSRGVLVLIRRKDASALLATICAIWWSFLNLPDTIKNRELTQRTRGFTDKKILQEVFIKDSLIDIYNKNFRNSKLLW